MGWLLPRTVNLTGSGPFAEYGAVVGPIRQYQQPELKKDPPLAPLANSTGNYDTGGLTSS